MKIPERKTCVELPIPDAILPVEKRKSVFVNSKRLAYYDNANDEVPAAG